MTDNKLLSNLKLLYEAVPKVFTKAHEEEVNIEYFLGSIFTYKGSDKALIIPSVTKLEDMVVKAFTKDEMRLNILYWGTWDYSAPNLPHIYSRDPDRLTALTGFMLEPYILDRLKEMYNGA